MPFDFNGRTQEEVRRYYLWEVCPDKQALHDWIVAYLNIDMPDSIVDPDSNSSPMDMIWELYSKSLENDPDFYRAIYYANRGGGKTLSASITETLSVLHLGRSVIHMAALGQQSEKAQEYVKSYFRMPYLRDFVVGDNAREVIVVRWYNPLTCENLTQKEYAAALRGQEVPGISIRGNLQDFIEKSEYIRIIMATVRSANGEHAPMFFCDEVDIIENPAAYEEAKNIPEARDGKLPITVLFSTRKYSFGMVQKEIDEAHKSGLHIRHWNAIDMTEACPPKRHLPDEPKIPIYRSDEQLRAISEDTYNQLSEPEKLKYTKEEGFAGCLKNCKIFAACKGRLATHQHCKSPMLKPIPSVQGKFTTNSLEMQKAQLLCLKPASTGLIYNSLDRSRHVISPARAFEMITGDPPPSLYMAKAELLAHVTERDYRWYGGMDFGYSHNFAVIVGFVFGNKLFVTHSIAIPELEPHQQVAVCEPLKVFNPSIYPDMENPQMVKVFTKAGFRMVKWTKGKGSVLGGIDIVRMKLNPGGGMESEVYFVRDDEDDPPIDALFDNLKKYHWKIDATGNPSNVPDDTDDDPADAFRYMVMNVFAAKGKVIAPAVTDGSIQYNTSNLYNPRTWMSDVIRDRLAEPGEAPTRDANDKKADEKGSVGKKGTLLWDVT